MKELNRIETIREIRKIYKMYNKIPLEDFMKEYLFTEDKYYWGMDHLIWTPSDLMKFVYRFNFKIYRYNRSAFPRMDSNSLSILLDLISITENRIYKGKSMCSCYRLINCDGTYHYEDSADIMLKRINCMLNNELLFRSIIIENYNHDLRKSFIKILEILKRYWETIED